MLELHILTMIQTNKFYPKFPAKIQRFYRRNRRRAIREILNKPNSSCNIPHEDLKNKFYNEENISFDESIFKSTEVRPFTASEIKTKLQRCENTAPGQDRLTYNPLKGIDPDCKALAQMFNICLKAKRIPETWKTSTTVFMPKTGDPNAPENWRPISLSCTLYKIFTSLVASRLSKCLEQNQLLSPQQKGFRPYDETLEKNYLLENRVRSAKKLKKKQLLLLFIDIKNALVLYLTKSFWQL